MEEGIKNFPLGSVKLVGREYGLRARGSRLEELGFEVSADRDGAA